MAFRFFALTLLFGLLYGGLGFKLYRLQIEDRVYYFERAEARNRVLAELELRRGEIFLTDRYSKLIPAALNRDYPVIYAVPKEIEDPILTAELLAGVTDIPKEELIESLSNKESLFKLLADKAGNSQILAVEESGIRGIYIDKKQYRFYNFGDLLSQVIGFVGLTEEYDKPRGLYGIEKLHEEELAAGSDIQLTIDRNLQSESERILAKLAEKFDAISGTIIIEEPATGKILTMASRPAFDPNEYSKFPIKNFLNPALHYVYEPGSVFKPLTMAAGIDLGILTPETTFVDSGSVTLNSKTIRNWNDKIYGKVTMTQVIENSINTGAVYAESIIGHKNFYNYLKKFGFGERTAIDLPDESSGSLRNLERKDARAIDFATASFGQGTAVTPIQLINAFSALANGGLFMRPYINAEAKPYVAGRVIKEETAKEVIRMMESAVEKAGVAAIPQYGVAGKTGTALIPDFERGGYTEELIHTFVGFAPSSQPRFVILIKLDKPSVGELAALTVVPAFRELAEFVLNYYSIPPDKLGNQE